MINKSGYTWIILLLISFTSCDFRKVDYDYSTTYIVRNKMESMIIVESYHLNGEKIKTDTIASGDDQKVYGIEATGGKGGKISKGWLPFSLVILYRDTFNIKINPGDTAIWQFSSEPYIAKYLLVADSAMIYYNHPPSSKGLY
jgi:hypothetical protein